jgi:hypothetical protein
MSRSKMAEEEEWLGEKTRYPHVQERKKRKRHTQRWARREWSRASESPVDGRLCECAVIGVVHGGRERGLKSYA